MPPRLKNCSGGGQNRILSAQGLPGAMPPAGTRNQPPTYSLGFWL